MVLTTVCYGRHPIYENDGVAEAREDKLFRQFVGPPLPALVIFKPTADRLLIELLGFLRYCHPTTPCIRTNWGTRQGSFYDDAHTLMYALGHIRLQKR